ncbi:hypothetical protein F383_00892 [Gossypium arboreum]|uniref:Uncharacterized protein n=1 Tax=Gossypium arboreum TaxID=29729 RepID=A0A0B0P7M7_GOSAR|nr:hypothetical protein F383_00892 [Gossypium arboreum]
MLMSQTWSYSHTYISF